MITPAEGSTGSCPNGRRVPKDTTTCRAGQGLPQAHLAVPVGTTQSARKSYAYCVYCYAYCVRCQYAPWSMWTQARAASSCAADRNCNSRVSSCRLFLNQSVDQTL